MTNDLASTNLGVEIRAGVWQHDFKSARDFLEALHPLSGYWPPDETWIFRGHANAAWHLLPTAHRAKAWEPFTSINAKCFNPPGADDMVRGAREMQLIREFFDAANEAALNVPDFTSLKQLLDPHSSSRSPVGDKHWPNEALVPILALAQHYGLPTRLLDWSRRGRVAAYFAALDTGEHPSHLAVWALNRSAPAEIRLLSEHGQWHFGTAPGSSNPNLHAQSGLFTYCQWQADGLLPLDELVSDNMLNFMSAVQHRGPAPCVMRQMVLPREAAKDLMRLLHIEGVSGLTMFPGFSGATRYVQERLWCGLATPPVVD